MLLSFNIKFLINNLLLINLLNKFFICNIKIYLHWKNIEIILKMNGSKIRISLFLKKKFIKNQEIYITL